MKPVITPSGEDYLEAVLVLQQKQGMVRSVDVARHMEVSKPSVCHAVATLRDGGFLTMDSDYFLHLTDVRREVAEQIYEKHRFFTDRLIEAGVDPESAERDACRMEHVISQESFERLRDAYKTKKNDLPAWQTGKTVTRPGTLNPTALIVFLEGFCLFAERDIFFDLCFAFPGKEVHDCF